MEDVKKYTLDESHLYFAKTLNGKVWELLQKTERSRDENELMLYAAQASCYHWLNAGTGLHHQRAEWLISHVFAELGNANAALTHAVRCLELTEQHAELMQDFDLAYAHEAAARANALAGRRDDALAHLKQAEELGQAIKDQEDKEIFTGDLNSGNWYGIKQ